MIGFIHSLESFATFEGRGIRTAVFMSGCHLRCAFCHNPDTWTFNAGQEVLPDSLAKRILRFKPYFSRGGGVTFTGGEPLLQADFILEVIQILKASNINVAIDSSISILNDSVLTLYNSLDFVIADLKFNTAELYKSECGSDVFKTVIESLEYLNQSNIPVILRTVIIPSKNDTIEDINKYFYLVKYFKNIKTYELKPFHTMGFTKYADLGIINPYANIQDANMDIVLMLQDHLNNLIKGVN
ncbi:MAG: 4Fe-4S cluster-binding domain-containing protein [Christensenellaceae bacterium]|jgi:pyruvate formate lyase activating enzyme|nr:4Fe-4S cluster-binding domain-containing protein [Christensenellaceae bacterium]